MQIAGLEEGVNSAARYGLGPISDDSDDKGDAVKSDGSQEDNFEEKAVVMSQARRVLPSSSLVPPEDVDGSLACLV